MSSFLFCILTHIVLIMVFRFKKIDVRSLSVLMGPHCWGAQDKEASLETKIPLPPWQQD